MTWFPIYLVHYRHIAFLKAGFLATLPFIAAYCGVLLSGFLSDRLLRRGYSLSFARKAPIVTGLVLATSIIGANFVQSPALIIGFMTVAFFGSGLSAISWSLVSSIAPVNLVGLASGAFNFVGTSMGITVPLVIGFRSRRQFRAGTLLRRRHGAALDLLISVYHRKNRARKMNAAGLQKAGRPRRPSL